MIGASPRLMADAVEEPFPPSLAEVYDNAAKVGVGGVGIVFVALWRPNGWWRLQDTVLTMLDAVRFDLDALRQSDERDPLAATDPSPTPPALAHLGPGHAVDATQGDIASPKGPTRAQRLAAIKRTEARQLRQDDPAQTVEEIARRIDRSPRRVSDYLDGRDDREA
jgi:hypothetical protein